MTTEVRRLKCHICTTSSDNTDANDICYLNITNGTLKFCPDLSYTSCFLREDSYRTVSGSTYFIAERGCSKNITEGCNTDGCNETPSPIIGIGAQNVTVTVIQNVTAIPGEKENNATFSTIATTEKYTTAGNAKTIYVNIFVILVCLMK